jgi:hypothetical protein
MAGGGEGGVSEGENKRGGGVEGWGYGWGRGRSRVIKLHNAHERPEQGDQVPLLTCSSIPPQYGT